MTRRKHIYYCGYCHTNWSVDRPRGEGPCPCCEHETVREIVVWHAFPPIPIRSSDYQACFDGEEERGEYGEGATADAAVNDLIANYT